jgi:hypothetical protein
MTKVDAMQSNLAAIAIAIAIAIANGMFKLPLGWHPVRH